MQTKPLDIFGTKLFSHLLKVLLGDCETILSVVTSCMVDAMCPLFGLWVASVNIVRVTSGFTLYAHLCLFQFDFDRFHNTIQNYVIFLCFNFLKRNNVAMRLYSVCFVS